MKAHKKGAALRSTQGRAGHWHVHVRHGVFLLLGMLLMWGILHVVSHSRAKALHKNGSRGTAGNGAALQGRPPWGQLEVTQIILERPEDFYQEDLPAPKPLRWFFRGYDAQNLSELIKSAELTAAQKMALLDSNRWERTPEGTWLAPPLEVVLEMSPAARQRLYDVLAESPLNVCQRAPFVYRADSFEEWFSRSDLPAAKVEQIRKMLYRRKGLLCFSDSQAFHLISTTNEVKSLLRTLSRIPSLLMTLRVNAQSDVPALLRYWGTEASTRSLRPLLESMARADGASLNVSYFLPPMPQKLLYTYPEASWAKAAKAPDCFWTAMNFFGEQPDARFFDPAYTIQVLKTEYQRVPKADTFGDVILFYRPGAVWETVHMCVFIAEDAVFTKNGADLIQPWVLMRMADVLAHYPSAQPLEMAVYRRNRK